LILFYRTRNTERGPALLSLPNAESAEDAVEQIVGVDGADHFAELVERPAQLQGQHFRRLLEQDTGMGLAQMFEAGLDMVPAAA